MEYPSNSQVPRTQIQIQANSAQPSLAASFRVLQTTELLEAILMRLPKNRHMLLIQRTSKTFRDTIKGSLHLQRELFLSPPLHKDKPSFNPMLLDISTDRVEECYDRTEANITARTLILRVYRLKAVFKYNEYLWALTKVRYMQTPANTNDESRDWRMDPNHSQQALDWSLIRIAQNEKISCPTFDLSSSSLQDMYLTQPSANMTVVLYSGDPDATVVCCNDVLERVNVSTNRCMPYWHVMGEAVAKFETQGETIGAIFARADAMKWKYRLGPALSVRQYSGCDCKVCDGRRGPEEREERLKVLEVRKNPPTATSMKRRELSSRGE